MRVLITAGATREPIDDVRFVSNVSTGRLGVSLTEAFLGAGWDVTLVAGVGAYRPRPHAALSVVEFGSTEDLLRRLEAELRGSHPPDTVVHAAAVSDYRPVPTEGKLSSSSDELVVRMTPTPKVADQLRGFKSDITLVMFKLESQIDRDELHRRARRTMARAGADFIVANRLEDVTADHHRADLLTATDATPLEGRAAIACGLIDVLTARGKS